MHPDKRWEGGREEERRKGSREGGRKEGRRKERGEEGVRFQCLDLLQCAAGHCNESLRVLPRPLHQQLQDAQVQYSSGGSIVRW